MIEVQEDALHYLATHQVMTIATSGEEGVWAAAVFYVNDGFDFIFLSAAHTRHAQNFKVNPQVAATIQEDYKEWEAIQGIQLEGLVARLTGDEKRAAITLYRQKYKFLNQPTPQIEAAFARVNWYRLRPTRLYFIDNRKGLGHRDEVDVTA